MKQRMVMDTSTGQADLAWALVQIFFLMTFVAARPAGGLVGEVAGEVPGGQPIVVALALDGALSVRDPAGLPAPEGAVEGWLAAQCKVPREVLLDCPEQSSHRDCRAALARLVHAGPGCRFAY